MAWLFLLFGFLPYQLASWINLTKDNCCLISLQGLSELCSLFYIFGLLVSSKDIHRVFEYHGAEHKSVHAYDHEQQLNVKTQLYTTIHPRCGTSFMFFVLLISILVYSIVDSIVSRYFGFPQILVRLAYHLLLLPFIAGLSYEVLKKSEKNLKHPIVKIMTIPGMAMQKITTQEPSEDQIEVAIVALKAALELDLSEYTDIRFVDKETKD